MLELAGEPITPEATRALTDYRDSHGRGHLGRIDHRPHELGLDTDELRTRFTPYVDRFPA